MSAVTLNHTHDASARSWLASANAEGSDFPIQNLPFGVFLLAAAMPVVLWHRPMAMVIEDFRFDVEYFVTGWTAYVLIALGLLFFGARAANAVSHIVAARVRLGGRGSGPRPGGVPRGVPRGRRGVPRAQHRQLRALELRVRMSAMRGELVTDVAPLVIEVPTNWKANNPKVR